jgi:hypothetical protein
MRHADKNTPPPTPLDESRWLPRRAKRKARKSRDEKQLTQAEVVSQKITQAFSDWW